jgi:hypothetical protein
MKTKIELTDKKIATLKEMAIRAALEEIVNEKGLNLEDFVDRVDYFEMLGISNWYLMTLEIDDCEITENDLLVHLFGDDAKEFVPFYAEMTNN